MQSITSSDSAEDSTDQTIQKLRQTMLLYQQRQLQILLKHVWARSPFYRDYYTGHGIKESDITHISVTDLPILLKKKFVDNFDRVVTDPRLRRKELHEWFATHRDPNEHFCKDLVTTHSSGTSGDITISAYDRKAWTIADTTMAGRLPPPENFSAGRTKVAFHIVVDGHFATVTMAKSMPKDVYDILLLSVLTPMEQTIRDLNAFQPHRLMGYSSSVAQLAKLALEGHLKIHPQRVFVAGDRLTEAMEKQIRTAWNASLYVLYASAESKYMALRTPEHDQMVVMDDLNIIEVVDDSDQAVGANQEGRVLVTNLYNHTLPVLRYELGDYVVRGEQLPNSPFTTLRDIRGRVSDALPIVLSNGQHDSIHPMVLATFFVPTVEKVQFVSAGPERLRIDYVAPGNLDAVITKEFERMVQPKGQVSTAVDARQVPEIYNDPKTGKLRLVRFEIDPGTQPYQVMQMEAPGAVSTPVPFKQDTPALFAREEIEQSIPSRFERQVELHANRLAIKSATQALSYAELNDAANRVAHAIVGRLGTNPETVALLLQPGIPAVIAILGILKAGKCYVALDPVYPVARLAGILDEAQTPLLLTADKDASLALALGRGPGGILNIDTLDSGLSSENPRLNVSPDSMAYLFYTSGSTGRPKGVAHSHRNALHQVMTYTNAMRLTSQDRMTQLHSHAFSASRLDIFGALLNGAALFPFSLAEEGIGRFARLLIDEKITLLHWIPAAFRHFAGTLDERARFPGLRLIALGSEPLTTRDVELYKRHFSQDGVLVNRFGTTETGNIRFHFLNKQSGPERGSIPVGYAMEDTEVLLLDETGRDVGIGKIGEMAVKSSYLSSGYWRRPDLAGEGFSPAPGEPGKTIFRTGDMGELRADGCLLHLGRKDLQVKIRGYRVEVGEVERALLDHPGVAAAVVAVRPDDAGEKRLVAYYVSGNEAGFTGTALRNFLEMRLASYMLPAVFVPLDALPLTPTGKVDREALPKPALAGSDSGAKAAEPRTAVESTLAAIWTSVLALASVGIHDNFFDLGGHSLHAMMIVSRVYDAFKFEISLRDFFELPTIAHMAEAVETASQTNSVDPELAAALAEVEALSEEQARQLLEEEGEKK